MSLQERIRRFYDDSSGLWEQVWGEHMHHGYYGPTGKARKERRQAQADLLEELLQWGNVQQASRILDVGCGIGGSSLELVQRFPAEVVGITLSPVQANRARERAVAANLSDRATFQVADAMTMPFADQSFDLVWSLESGEHMPDKQAFLQECYRVLKPGGKLLLVTWCHRPASPPDPPLTEPERQHLEKIYQVYHLPYVISLPDYAAIAQSLNFQNIQTADWSAAVAPFWDVVIGSAFNLQVMVGLLKAGWPTIQGALALGLMRRGYRQGLIRFGLLQGIR
jgi:tocopherol O-methyltransferase